jgi:transposase
VEQFIAPARRGGAKRTVDVREVVNGLMYVLSTGCRWRAIPKDLPPNRHFAAKASPLGHSHARDTPSPPPDN